MTQTAVVKRILSAEIAEISLMRQMECGLNCKSCEGCPQKPADELLALAENPVGADVGDVVTVRPNTGGAVGAAALVWLLPCLSLVLGYLVAEWLGASQGIGIVSAFAGLAAGFLPAVLVNRAAVKRNQPEFSIVSRGR